MTTCKECGAQHVDGALYCNECGNFLMSVNEKDDELTIQIPSLPSSAGSELTLPLERNSGNGVRVERVVFIILSSGRRAAFDLNGEIMIGRSDPNKDIWPEFDLSHDQGFDFGVSRQHAQLQACEQGIMIRDLGSTNGTQLNNRHLPPDQVYPLRNGDHLQFGGLRVQVFFES